MRSFRYRRVHVHPASSFILIPSPMSSMVTANLISLSVGLFLFEGCILCVPNVRFRLSAMTLCIAFFLCLISVLSYDLVQVKSSGCWDQYSFPSHGSEDSLCIARFFLNFIPSWIFRWFPVSTVGIASAQKPGVCVSLPTKVYYEFFFKLSMQ